MDKKKERKGRIRIALLAQRGDKVVCSLKWISRAKDRQKNLVKEERENNRVYKWP